MPIESINAPQLPTAVSGIVDGTPQDDPAGKSGISGDDKPVSKKKPARGPWLEQDEETVAKELDEAWTAQEPAMKKRLTRWDFNEMRRGGDCYSKLQYVTDEDRLNIYTPMGIEFAPPFMDKTDELCEKMIANLLNDPPQPEAEPSKDNDAAEDAAEFATRFLKDQGAESSLNVIDAVDMAEDIACSCGSGFVRIYVDPKGNGSRPKEMLASQSSMTVDDALFVTVPASVDPMTGQPIPESTSAQPRPYVLRYVRDDQTLTDDPNEAAREWLPSLKKDVISPRHVRFIPDTATDISDAEGCLLAVYITLGRLKGMFKRVAEMPPDDLRALVAYRPAQTNKLLPKWARDRVDHNSKDGVPSDNALVLTMTGIRVEGGDHPDGAYVVMAGGKYLLDRRPWCRYIVDPETKRKEKRANSLPLAQFKQFADSKDRDPYGRGLVDKLAGGDPLMAAALHAVIDYVAKANNPHLFVPSGSGITNKELTLPRGTPIPYNAAAGGTPIFEQIGPFAREVMEMYTIVDQRMNQRSGLSDTAQGLENSNSKSGIAKQIVVETALVALSRVKRNMDNGWTRLQRVILEQGQMGLTVPQFIKIVGEDGAYKYREFTSTDLGSTVDVKIAVGTGTMLTPSAKSAILNEEFQMGAISPEEFREAKRTGIRTLVSLQDDPQALRINRQIAQWELGPPEGWKGPQADPMTGQVVESPPPVDPANPFADVLPSDEEPAVAPVRLYHLRRAIAGTKYQRKPKPWQQYLAAEYERMRYAAGVQTIREQQQAQQQAMAQQQQVADQAAASERETREGDRAAQREEANADRGQQQELAAMNAQSAERRDQLKSQTMLQSAAMRGSNQ